MVKDNIMTSFLTSASLNMLCLGSLFIWYITSAIYSWYRLRKIPGPSLLTSFSYLWLGSTTYSGKQYWIHRDLHKKHGPLVRIGPNEILTDDPEILKKISSARNSYSRDEWYLTGRFNPYHDNIFTLLEPRVHKRAKARIIPAYNGREIPALEIGVDKQVKNLVNLLHQKYVATNPSASQPLLDFGSVSCYFTMDVITRLAFGQEFGYLKDDTDHYNFLRSVRELWPVMSTSADIPWVRNLLFSRPVLKLLGPKPSDKAGFGALMAVAEHHVGKRFASDAKEEQDMLGSFIRHGLNQKECEVEGLFMIIGGTESVATALRSTLIHTITSPQIYQKLKSEIKLALSEGRASSPISIEEAKRLPYLQAVVYEGIRIRPPLLGLFPKVVPAGGDTFHGKFIPAGTAICMNLSSFLCSKALFGEDADVFRPERFMELDHVERVEMERNVELVFGYGQYMCVGKMLAFMELNKVMFEVLKAFDFQLISPMKPCDVLSYGVFLETNMLIKVTECTL